MSYGTLVLLDSSPSGGFAEPVSVAQVKTYLGLPKDSPSDRDEDAQIEGFISAAREVAETFQGRDLVRKYWRLTAHSFSGLSISLRVPLVEVIQIRYRDSDGNYTVLAEGTDYIVDTVSGAILPPYGETWPSYTPWPVNSVEITFTSGYDSGDIFWSDSGKRIMSGMLLLISQWFNNRLPFEPQMAIAEYPFAITALFSMGALPRAY